MARLGQVHRSQVAGERQKPFTSLQVHMISCVSFLGVMEDIVLLLRPVMSCHNELTSSLWLEQPKCRNGEICTHWHMRAGVVRMGLQRHESRGSIVLGMHPCCPAHAEQAQGGPCCKVGCSCLHLNEDNALMRMPYALAGHVQSILIRRCPLLQCWIMHVGLSSLDVHLMRFCRGSHLLSYFSICTSNWPLLNAGN